MGAAANTENRTESASLPKCGSIFTAETHAVYLALNTIPATKEMNLSIFRDSRSCLQALHKQIPTNQKVRKLKRTIAYLQKKMELCWIPVHAGIPWNEVADKKAEEASRQQEETIACPYQDIFWYLVDAVRENVTQSGMEKVTSWKKSNQVPGHGKKIIDVERMKLLSTGSELAIQNWPTGMRWKVFLCLNVSIN